MAFRKTYFQKVWMNDTEFKNIFLPNPAGRSSAICVICNNKVTRLSNMGKRALTSHITRKEHLNMVKLKDSNYGFGLFASVKSKSSTISNEGEVEVEDLQRVSFQEVTPVTGIQKYLTRDDVIMAEIWWCLYVIENHLSLRSAGVAYKIFPKMFPDSTIAPKIELGRTKISYNIIYGLASYFHDLVLKDLNDSDCFVVFFDESLNKFSQQQQMDVSVQYWDRIGNQVTTRYLTSAFLGYATAVDLLHALLESLKPLELKKLLQVSMDGPNVNLKMIKDLETYLKESKDPNDPIFMFMGTCGLHIANNAFKTGFSDKSTSWYVISYLRALYNLFKDVPARRSDLIRYSESSLLPLKFCAVRSLNNSFIALRGKELLPNLAKFKEGIENDPKHPVIKSYSYGVVKEALKDKLMGCKLSFFSFIALEIEPFLIKFQSDAPMAPFLYTELTIMITNLLSMIVKNEVLTEATSVLKVDLKDSKNLIAAKDFSFSFSVKAELRKIKLTDKEMLMFKALIVKNICLKLIDKSPLKYKLCKAVTFCDPILLSREKNICSSRLENVLQIFQDKQWLSGSQCDCILKEFKTLCLKPDVILSFKSYDKKQRLDHFWNTLMEIHKSSNVFSNFLKKILILSQGNAFVERGFSINKEVIIENQSAESLIGQRQVYDGLKIKGGLLKIEEIPKSMLLKIKNSQALYEEALKKKKTEKDENKNDAVLKKRLIDEINSLRKEKRKILTNNQRELENINERLQELRGSVVVS